MASVEYQCDRDAPTDILYLFSQILKQNGYHCIVTRSSAIERALLAGYEHSNARVPRFHSETCHIPLPEVEAVLHDNSSVRLTCISL